MSSDVKIRLLADISDVERKLAGLERGVRDIRITLSTDDAEKSIREVSKDINKLNNIRLSDKAPAVGSKQSKEEAETSKNTRTVDEKNNRDIYRKDEKASREFLKEPDIKASSNTPDTTKFLQEIIRLIGLGSKIKDGKPENILPFMLKLIDVNAKYKEFSSYDSKESKDLASVGKTANDERKTDQHYDKVPEADVTINKYLEDILRLISTGDKQLSDRFTDIGKYLAKMSETYKKVNATQPTDIDRHSDSSMNETSVIHEKKDEQAGTKEDASHFTEKLKLLSRSEESKQSINSKAQEMTGSKKGTISSISESKLAENALRSVRQLIGAGDKSGKMISSEMVGQISGDVIGGLVKTLGGKLIGNGAGAAAGAAAGTAGAVSGAAGTGAAVGTAGTLAAGSIAIPIAGIALAAAAVVGKKLFDYAKQGSSDSLSVDAQVYQTLGKTNYYGSDLNQGRKEWYNVGKQYGYSTEESLQSANAFMKQAGYTDMKSLKGDITALQSVSRAYGLDANKTAETAGSLNRMGTINDGEQRKFVNMLSETIKSNGMRGREDEQVEVIKSLAENIYSHQMNVSQNDLMGMLNLQSKMVDVNEGFKGQKGADVITQLNEGIINGGGTIDMLLGWGTEYSGMGGDKGRWAFEMQKAKGIGVDSEEGMDNLASLIRNFEKFTGRSAESDEFKLMIKQYFGLETKVVNELLSDPKFVKYLKSTDEQSKALQDSNEKIDKNGTPKDIKANINSFNDSNFGAKTRNENSKANLKQDAGNVWNNIVRPFDMLGRAGRDTVSDAGRNRLFINRSNADGESVFGSFFGASSSKKSGVNTDKKTIPQDTRVTTSSESTALRDTSINGKPTSQQKQQGELLDKELRIINMRKDINKGTAEILASQEKQLESEQRYTDLKNAFSITDKQAAKETKPGIMESIFGRNGFFGNLFGSNSSESKSKSEPGAVTASNQQLTLPSSPSKEKESAVNQNINSSSKSVEADGLSVHTKLRRDSNVTADQLNEIIKQNASKAELSSGRESLLRGQGEAFIEASKATGIHPVDILSQAALESGWGTSDIAYDKKNFFGIGAFDASPYASAYSFKDDDNNNSTKAGIIEGSKWIARNYVDKGQDSFYSMRWNNGVHQYATDEQYDTKLNNIRKSIYSSLPEEATKSKSDQADPYTTVSADENNSSGNIPKLAIGHDYIPYDGFLAELHKGETVLPKYLAEKWRSGDYKEKKTVQEPLYRDILAQPIPLPETLAPMERLLPASMFQQLLSGNNSSSTSTQNINLNISGKILGMDKENQGIVSSAIQRFFTPDTGTNNNQILKMLENNTVRRRH